MNHTRGGFSRNPIHAGFSNPTKETIMKLPLVVALVISICSFSAHSAAPITVSEFVQMKENMGNDKDHTLVIYVSGAADALHSANTILGITKRPKLYCRGETPISANEAIIEIDQLLSQQIMKGNIPRGDLPAALVLANALSAKYPCRK